MARAFLGLGSNLGDRWALLRRAVVGLPDVVAVSPVYETDPVGGPAGQGAYLNLVVELQTGLDPHALLATAQAAEQAAGRERAERWGPRTLDVDVLWVEGVAVDEPDLVVPHPRMGERRFVLAPLADLAPDLVPASRMAAAVGDVRAVGPLHGRARFVGPGRAGRALASALARRGWEIAGFAGRDDDLRSVTAGVDAVVISTPDGVIADVAASIPPDDHAVVLHLAGSLGLDVLAGHARRAAVHPLVALPDAVIGARRLLEGAWFALAEGGDPLGARLVASLGGRSFPVADERRAAYHAAACIASNHLVVLLGQVERVAASAGVPFDAYLDLVRGTIDNVAVLGPAAALTGPAARGDEATIARHLAALAPAERPLYEALAAEARRLARSRAAEEDSR